MKGLFCVAIFILLFGCSSSRLVDEYVDTETPRFQPSKVLVVGLTPNGGLQRQFEYSLVQALEAKNVVAVKSVDFFGNETLENENSEENLDSMETKLMAAGFDAVLFSKITGQESLVTLGQSYRNLTKTFETFSDYYYGNKPVYDGEPTEDYPVYNTETSLYCLCSNRELDLIWRGKIDIVDPPEAATTIRDYVKTLMRAFKKNQLFAVK